MEVTSKICSRCGFILPAHALYFYSNKNTKHGLMLTCKKCLLSRSIEYYKKNRDEINKGRRKNRNKISIRDKKYRENNKEKITKQRVEYRKKNKEKFLEYKTKYRKHNKEKVAADKKKYEMKKAKYKTHNQKLKKYEDIRNKNGYLEIRCAYCGKWFIPTNMQVKGRRLAINSICKGENRFYCQDFCKIACPIYGQITKPKQNQYTKSNEVNPQLRQRVFELDNYECQMCGSKDELHCHHILPATLNPMTANDPDVCITLCKKCHANVHSKEGCRYHELKCKT